MILEKLLLLFTITPATLLPLSKYSVIVPPAPPLLNAVTIELLLIVFAHRWESHDYLEINMTLPVVFTFRFVNVLLLIFCESVAAELIM